MCNFPKKCTKMEFHENKPIKKYLIDGACLLYAYYFSKIYIVCHIIRQEKDHHFVFQQNNVKVQQYSKILLDLVILELISLNGQLLRFVVLDLMVL